MVKISDVVSRILAAKFATTLDISTHLIRVKLIVNLNDRLCKNRDKISIL